MLTIHYDDRSIAILELVETHGVNPGEGNDIEVLRQVAKAAKDKKDFEQSIEKILEEANFELKESDGDYKTYAAVVTNSTDKAFEHFSLDMKLMDADGVTVDTPQCHISAWLPGEKMRFEFDTDKSFDNMHWGQYDYSLAEQ